MMRIDVDEWQIRSFRTQDSEALARYANNRNVSRNLRDEFPYPYTLAMLRPGSASRRSNSRKATLP